MSVVIAHDAFQVIEGQHSPISLYSGHIKVKLSFRNSNYLYNVFLK